MRSVATDRLSNAAGDSGAAFDEELPINIGDEGDVFASPPKARRVRASAEGLDVEGVRTIARDQIETAFSSAGNEQRVVIADRTGHRLTIHVRSRAEAVRLLTALSFMTTEKNAVFRLLPAFHAPSVRGLILPFAILCAALLAKEAPDALPILALIVLAILVVSSLKIFSRKLTVGRDGITVAGFGGSRFIPYSDVTSVDRYSDTSTAARLRRPRRNEVVYSGVMVHLRGSEAVRLPIVRGVDATDELLGTAERIDEALKAWREARPVGEVTVDRAGRETHEWVSSLREIGKSEATTYRLAAVNREALFAIVEDPGNQASSRAAAAIAIGAKLDDEARTRLRLSAAAIADPKLRVAVEHVVDDKNVDELAELLNEIAPIEEK
jgi:hypothetical protein